MYKTLDPALFALGFIKFPAAFAIAAFEPVNNGALILACLVVGALEVGLSFLAVR